MDSDLRFRFPLPQGLHARPASRIQETAAAFASEILWDNLRTGGAADAKSVLALIGSDTLFEDPCLLRLTGPDAADAAEALRRLILEELPRDEAAAEQAPPPPGPPLPWILTRGDGARFIGQAASPGIVIGLAHVHDPEAEPERKPGRIEPGRAADERARFAAAVREQAEALGRRRDAAGETTARAILGAHLAILNDRGFAAEAGRLISGELMDAASAVRAAGRLFRDRLGAGRSRYLRERMADIADVATGLAARLEGKAGGESRLDLAVPSILVADDLAPSEFLALDPSRLLGLALESAGMTSHTLILARARGVPAAIGCPGLVRRLRTGEEIVLDGTRGLIVPSPSEDVRRYFAREAEAEAAAAARRSAWAALPGRTADGRKVDIAANIGHPDEMAGAWAQGAEGVGLFRTEMILLGRTEEPGEEDQYALYARAAREAGGRPVIIRTFDIGGDKPLPFLALPAERNPFLGFRGVRIYERFAGLIRTQVRALLRAAVHGPLKIMVPMVAALDEIVRFKALVRSAAGELAAEGVPHRADVEVGMMVEVPAAAFLIDRFAAEVDFFSVGSNDLLQYAFAADRGHPDVRALNRPLDPAFLRLLDLIVRSARAAGRWIGLCGEMAGAARSLPILVGLGFDELSMSAPRIPALKAGLSRLRQADARALAEAALAAARPEDVEAALDAFHGAASPSDLTEPALIGLGDDSRSKDEALQRLAALMEAAERVERRADMEEALRRREETFSTSIGFGVAIPHGQSAAVRAPSLALLRFREPFLWNPDDEEPVDLAVMLAIPAGRAAQDHLKLLARLSRRLVHEDFRDALRAAADAGAAIRLIREAVSP